MANAIRLMANAISVTRSHSGKTVCQTDMANAIRLMANAISVKRSYSEKNPNGERRRHNGERHLAVMCIDVKFLRIPFQLSSNFIHPLAHKFIIQQSNQR